MTIDNELIDNLLKDYKKPEDIIGENGLLKQLTKQLLEQQFQRRAQKYRCSFANLSDNGEASEEEACRSCRHSPRFQATSGNQLCTMNTFERCLVKGETSHATMVCFVNVNR